MNNQKLTSPLLWVAILGAIKIVLDTVGIQIIDNQKVDALANGIAAAVTIIGIIVDHGVSTKKLSAQDVLDGVTKLVADLQPIISVQSQPVITPVAESATTQTITPEPLASEPQQVNQ